MPIVRLINTISALAPRRSRSKPAPKPTIVRRATYVCSHPRFGLSVLERETLFKNLIGKYSDECSRSNQDLQQLALAQLQSLFKHQYAGAERGDMFPLFGLSNRRTECTVFFFTLKTTGGYNLLSDDAYRPLAGHPSASVIGQIVSRFEGAQENPRRCQSGIG